MDSYEQTAEDGSAEIAELFAPWDAHAWDNLREAHGDTAARLEALVAGGVEPEAIRRYAEKHGYSPRVIGWLEQAAQHAQRQRQERTTATAAEQVGHAAEQAERAQVYVPAC